VAELLGRKLGSAKSFYGYIPGVFLIFSETEYLKLMSAILQTGEFAREILYVNSGSPVDVGRKFIGQEYNFHKIPR
jgi:hypothetical protein